MSEKDPKIAALGATYAALKPLDAQSREEVMSSVYALLGMGTPPALPAPVSSPFAHQPAAQPSAKIHAPPTRSIGLVELMQDKTPGTNPQRVTLFAYWREKHEGIPRFAREDLEHYFGNAKVVPPKNYDRDFNSAVLKGWIHEDRAESYITTKGIEVVENGFEGQRSYSTRAAGKKRAARREVAKKKGAKKAHSRKAQ